MANDPSLTDIGYVILFVRDMEKATAFYRDALGIPVGNASPEWTEFKTNGTVLALHHLDGAVPKGPGQSELVFNAEDVVATQAALAARDVPMEAPKKVWEAGGMVGIAAAFHDPDGNRLSIHGTVPADRWTD